MGDVPKRVGGFAALARLAPLVRGTASIDHSSISDWLAAAYWLHTAKATGGGSGGGPRRPGVFGYPTRAGVGVAVFLGRVLRGSGVGVGGGVG